MTNNNEALTHEELIKESEKCKNVVIAQFNDPINDVDEMLRLEIFLDDWISEGYKIKSQLTMKDNKTKNIIVTLINSDN